MDFEDAMNRAEAGSLVYCDPPYCFTQKILYLVQARWIASSQPLPAANSAASLSLSIDGSKKSGDMLCKLPIPKGLFEREALVIAGDDLRRFQMNGKWLEEEVVADRLLLTY